MTSPELLRKHAPMSIPSAILELIIANFIIGNYTLGQAFDLLMILDHTHFSKGTPQ